MPGFIPPLLATLRPAVPAGDSWIHEIKFDGYRLQAHVAGGNVTIYTRGGHDWTNRFPALARRLASLKADAIIDGEAVVQVGTRTNFSELQADLAAGRHDRIVFYAFDLLHLDGLDLKPCALSDRKDALRRVLKRSKMGLPVLFSENWSGDGEHLMAQACALQWEGIVSKRRDAPYRSGRREDWIKVKCARRAKFAIVGFDKAPASVAALHLARREGKALNYIGKVGTGFSNEVAEIIRNHLDPLITPHSVLSAKLRKAKTVSVEPKLFAEIEYRDITSDGYVRHGSFKGLYAGERSATNLTARSSKVAAARRD